MNAPDALNHPVRRQILRTLIERGGALKAGEIVAVAGPPELSVSVVGYHARVLESAGIVDRTDTGPANDESEYRFRATASEDPEIIALLDSTRDADLSDG